MEKSSQCGQAPRKGKPGFVFIVALLSMLAMVVVGTSFIGSANQQMQDARRDLDMLHSIAMADTGLNYLIWRQRYSTNKIMTFYDELTDLHALTPNSTPPPQVAPATLTFGEGTAAVWLFDYMPDGASFISYQLVSKGYFRGREKIVRAVLQGAIPNRESLYPEWLDYAIFADSSMIINTSTDIHGDIASNDSVYLNTSGGSNFKGNVRSANWVKLMKNSTSIDGTLTYGSTVYDSKGDIIEDSGTGTFFTGGAQKIPDGDPLRIELDGMDPDGYYQWAESYGSEAFYNEKELSDPSLVTTPILYVNSLNEPNFTIKIRTDLSGPLTIFVNGNLELHGNITLGTPEVPVAVIATGNIICGGTPTVHGMIWANGSFQGGTPNISGSVRCDTLGNFQGNPQIYFKKWENDLVTPPDFDGLWTISSWELL